MTIGLYITSGDGTADVTPLIQTITWSGDYQQCARTLDFGLTSSPTDTNVPTATCELGNGVVFKVDDEVLFNGFIFEREKDTESSVIDITCYDRGIYLKRNEAVYKFTNTTPEDITQRICTDFGITAGSVAETGVKISRNFIGVSLYNIIQTAYTLASEETEEKYLIRYEGDALNVIKKEVTEDTLVIEGGRNLMSSSTSESIKDMINQVVIYNSADKETGKANDTEFIEQYGLLQSYLRKTSGEDANKKAQKMLRDNGVSQKITVENLGNTKHITGNTVIVHEPYTGVDGLFYIDSDTHTWKKNIYLNKLVLNFKSIMDEQKSGTKK